MARKAKRSRQQLVCVVADNSGSMAGTKAEAATRGIREMLLTCQAKGPKGPDRSYYRFVLIRFGSEAQLDPQCNMIPVRQIDADSIEVHGDGGGTNMSAALEIALEGLQQYMQEVIEPHEERDEHPLPLVLFFSDGYNTGSNPLSYAKKIKNLGIDGEPVTLACAGVSTSPSDQPDEALLKSIASPGCYLSIRDVELLSAYLAEVGSSGASSPKEVAEIMGRLADMRDGCEQ